MSLKDGRCVARPLQNLGSTCFVNCVLQALAHAPELCMAVDAQPHSSVCPIAAENAATSSLASSMIPASKGNGKRAGAPSSNSSASSGASDDDPAVGSRRSSRGKAKGAGGIVAPGGRKSPSSDQDSNRSSNSRQRKYCVLCELESHFKAVHDLNRRDKTLAPSAFVNGFFEHVAPWFKLGVQEDAHEFLRLLIDAMQKSCQQARLQDNPQDDAASSAAAGDGGDANDDDPNAAPPVPSISISSGTVSKDDKEYPFALFRGMVESKVICAACQASSSTLDPIEDVGLEVSLDYPSGGPGDAAPAASSSSTRASRNASPLLPHGNASLADVQSAFQRFARVEQVDGYKCEKCGCTGRATKQSKLASIPPILTLHLKRFRYGDSRLIASGSASSGAASASYGSSYPGATGYGVPTVTTRSSRSGGRSEANQLNTQDFALGGKSGSAKIEGHVKFDLFFDLKPYLTPEMQTSVNSMFCRLFAVIVHAGKNSHSGHYIAYVQALNKNEWWKMDDGRVTLVDKTDVLQAEAYMLFYRVIQHPVAVTLSSAYDTLLNARRAADQNPSQAAALRADNGSSVVDAKTSNGRAKRSRSTTYRDGEAWARAKAPRLLGVAAKAQEVVSEALDLTSDFLQRIQDEASRDGAREDNGGGGLAMITEQDVLGGVSKVRQRLADLFYRLAQHYDDGSSSETPRPAFLDSIGSNGGSDTASVAAATAGSASSHSNLSISNGDRSINNGDRSSNKSNSNIAMGKANPKALTTKAAVGPSDKKSSVVVVDLMDDDATDVL